MPRTSSSEVFSKMVGARIRETRTHLGLTQAELARRLEVSGPYIAAVETGKHNLTIGQLGTIAGALGVTFDVAFAIPERGYQALASFRERAAREQTAASEGFGAPE